MGDFVISPLPRLLTKELCAAGSLCSTGVAPFQRYYGPSRHRLVFDRFPGASGYAVYLAPSISRRDEDGFSSCLACPCHRAVPTTPPEGCALSDTLATHPVAFVRHEKTRPLGSIFLSGPPMGSLVLRPGDSLTILKMALSVSFIRLVSSTNVPWCTTPIEAESSLGPDSHHPVISLSGIPSAVMVLRILHPILASTLCAANPLARIAEPTIAL